MHIRKLEISGFKSFVDKTVVHFDHDVIGIVGPNGCGKSNIVDAIRWCMGEQSAKHLRGRAMEDVIFNGSESRAQHGMAEVTLTFDNTDKHYAETLPAEYRDFPEIAVTRRLYRDGTSEYLINKTQVRLRDVTDLFLGTGVGTKAYSIVEQGRIGQIVSSRPQDRRLYIEEAAGITKYKLRRKQAERKMDLTRQNLLRVTDIVNEIDRTRNSLKRQAAKAERYIRYRDELEDLFLHDAAHRLLEMIVVQQAERTGYEQLKERSTELAGKLEQGEGNLAAARGEAAEVESRYEQVTARAAASEQRVTELRSEVTRSQDRTGHLEERLSQLGQERATLEERVERLTVESAELEERVEWLNRDETTRNSEASNEGIQLDGLKSKEREADERLATLRRESSAAQAEEASVRAKLESSEQRLAELTERKQQVGRERCEIATALERKKLEQQALETSVRELGERRAETTERAARLEAELSDTKKDHDAEAAALDTLKTEIAHKRSRFNVLTDLHRRLEGVGAGTKVLLSSDDPAVVGLLADRVEVEEEFTEAFASLLGDRLQCVIVRDPARGLELLDELRKSKGGRATIATQTPGFVAGARSGAKDDPSVLTRLIDEVRYSKEDEGLIRALVGDALVVRSASDAMSLNARFPGTTAVSLDGAVVREDGLVSGGSGDNMASAMLEQKREMSTLQADLVEHDEQARQANERCRELEARLEGVRLQLKECQAELRERELSHIGTEKDLNNSKNETQAAEQRYQRLSSEESEIAERSEQVATSMTECRDRLTELAQLEEERERALAEAESVAAERKADVAAQAAKATERQVRLAQVREQLEAARSSLTRTATELSAGRERLQQLVREARDAATALGQAAAQWMLSKEASQEAAQIAAAAQAELDDVRRLLEQIRTGLGEREGELRELRVALSEVDEGSRDGEMKLQKLGIEREHLLRNVAERFRGLDLLRVMGDYHARPAPDAEHRRRIDELSKLIDRMGPVNLDAKAEYEDAEERFVELSGQRDDIQQALDELDRAIRQMDRESKRRFRETFTTVNELFKRTFSRLFKGGRGELKLTDPENILETGVDIVAQPPGKKLGNIELMSGGEKALTATALIFAIFEYRPSPFCVLDEVDAPLDEANVSRYNEAIRAMTSNSQFVVITHIKKTMQSVDVLYGVTMGEPGVSRVVSVKVNQEAKSRSEKSANALSSKESVAPEAATVA